MDEWKTDTKNGRKEKTEAINKLKGKKASLIDSC